MISRVVVTLEAKRNLRDAYWFIRRDSPEAASRWVKGIRRSIRELSRFPGRCPVVSESGEFREPIREYSMARGIGEHTGYCS
jgi:plasmid stabilization system protein ParE